MSREVEVKLNYKDKNLVVSRLKSLGAQLKEKYELLDAYYSNAHHDMSNTHELLRIRKKKGKAELTFKGKCKDQRGIWERVELTTSITNPEVMHEILTRLGFKKITENKSIREEWTLNQTKITFIHFTHPAELKLLEIESPQPREIQKITEQLQELTSPAGEETFQKKFDQKKEKS